MVSCAWRSSGSVDTPRWIQKPTEPLLEFIFHVPVFNNACSMFHRRWANQRNTFWKCEQHTFIFIFQNPIRKLLWNMGYSFGIWNMILEYETTKYDLVSYYVLHIPKSCSKTIFHIQKSRSKTIFHVPKSYSKTIFQIHVPKANQPKKFMFHVPQKKMSQPTNHT